MSEKKLVCLDPGHGPSTVNGSPDGSYKEKEFAWDMYTRVKPLLEQQGITVAGTRAKDEMPSLTARAQRANSAGADLFVSLHTNAAGNGGWYDARGFLIYTGAAGDGAERNRAAQAILARARAAGVAIWGGGLAHEGYTVLVKTACPAVLIEYGFHTSREDVALLKDAAYREELALVTARGICDYLGVAWRTDARPERPAEDAVCPAAWAAAAWQKAGSKGVLDGTRPRGSVTRQELAVVLDRLGLL